MINFENLYFEPEVRDGFYVPAMVKRAWAAELEVLAEVDRICRKHNIEYFADWGTLLATVRHEGFIPWDDDLDIVMKRADYKRFMEVAQNELPEGFAAYNYKNHDDFWLFLARVVGKPRICFESDHLEHFHEFPYIAGVDIFVLDYVSRDEKAEEERNKLAMHTLAIADSFGELVMSREAQEMGLRKIEEECGIQIPRTLKGNEMRRFLYGVVEDLFDRFSEEDADEMTQLFPFGMKNPMFRFPKKAYEKFARLPYENTTMPVPIYYDRVLKKRYGDYMKLVRHVGGHDYPYFESQHKQLLAVLDFELPRYKFSADQLRTKLSSAGSFKELMLEYMNGIEQINQGLEQVLNETHILSEEQLEVVVGGLQESQQLAIDMGTLIERIKGEGHPTVTTLETYCEALFGLYNEVTQSGDIEAAWRMIGNSLAIVKESMEEDILSRKEIVFLPYKASQWKCIEKEWREAISESKTDVFVVPIPYYYKKYDGSRMESVYEGDKLPDEVVVINYEDFALELHHPDVIYIQNPYDEWNPVLSVPERFYSRSLQQQTDELIYIPPFEVEEFEKTAYRAYLNMRDYVTVPGVIRADKVLVQSENMRQLYIDKIMDFVEECGCEVSRAVWEAKIQVYDKQKITSSQSVEERLHEAGRQEAALVESYVAKKRKKQIVYGNNACFLIEYREQAINKIKYALSIFEANKDDITLIWSPHPRLQEFTEQECPDIWNDFVKIVDEYKAAGWGQFEQEKSSKELVQLADAYYGDSQRLALEFQLVGKPVMIQDVELT